VCFHPITSTEIRCSFLLAWNGDTCFDASNWVASLGFLIDFTSCELYTFLLSFIFILIWMELSLQKVTLQECLLPWIEWITICQVLHTKLLVDFFLLSFWIWMARGNGDETYLLVCPIVDHQHHKQTHWTLPCWCVTALLWCATNDGIVMITCLCAFVMWTSCCHGVLVCKECYDDISKECGDNNVRGGISQLIAQGAWGWKEGEIWYHWFIGWLFELVLNIEVSFQNLLSFKIRW